MDHQPPVAAGPRPVDGALDRAWRDDRRHLLDIAFRMLGSLSEAEDVVQEAFARLMRVGLDDIDDKRGWLTVVVSRLCLDKLRARRRHPVAPDASLGDRPGESILDPGDRVTLDDNVRIALHVVLARLTPAERTTFVLHDVFRYPFDEVAAIVGRSPAACRQLASRARRIITSDVSGARFSIEPADERRVTEQFIAACSSGDLAGLLAILDPDVAGEADVGGPVGVRADAGADVVAPLLLRYLGPDSSTTLLSVPAGDHAGVVAMRGGRLMALITLTLRAGRVEHIDALVDPIKLAPFAELLGS